MTEFRIAAIAMVIIVSVIGGCEINYSNKIAEAVKGGVDPLAARCAFVSNDNETCRILAQR